MSNSIQVGDKVAVYGSLRQGMGNHGLLSGLKPLSTTTVKGFDMYSYGAFPFITDGEGEVTVEVYEVDSDNRADRLDMLEGYPSFYDRKQVITEDGETVWVYFIADQRNDTPVKNGDWVEFKKKEWMK